MKQLGFASAFADSRLGSNKKLEEIDRLIDWSVLEPVAQRLRPGTAGRPPYEALAMLKALYLQRLYDLSDPGLEEALLDRLSFRVFCGFTLEERTPDETTILRFRHDAANAGVLEQCFALVTAQLEAQGLVLRAGTMMDASIIRAQRQPPPMAAGRGAVNPQEPDAGWTGRRGKTVLGYKAHVGGRPGLRLGAACGGHLGARLRERSGRRSDLWRRAGGLWRPRLSAQGAARSAQEPRHQGSHHASRRQASPQDHRLAGTLERIGGAAAGTGRGRIQRDEASLWPRARPLALPVLCLCRCLRFRHHLQSAKGCHSQKCLVRNAMPLRPTLGTTHPSHYSPQSRKVPFAEESEKRGRAERSRDR